MKGLKVVRLRGYVNPRPGGGQRGAGEGSEGRRNLGTERNGPRTALSMELARNAKELGYL